MILLDTLRNSCTYGWVFSLPRSVYLSLSLSLAHSLILFRSLFLSQLFLFSCSPFHSPSLLPSHTLSQSFALSLAISLLISRALVLSLCFPRSDFFLSHSFICTIARVLLPSLARPASKSWNERDKVSLCCTRLLSKNG